MKTQTKLPKRFKEKWVKALRSGKYEQGDGYLEYKNKYCCLGVACTITGTDVRYLTGNSFPSQVGTNKIPKILNDINSTSYNKKSTIAAKLANFNDNGKSFKWIASYIERYL